MVRDNILYRIKRKQAIQRTIRVYAVDLKFDCADEKPSFTAKSLIIQSAATYLTTTVWYSPQSLSLSTVSLHGDGIIPYNGASLSGSINGGTTIRNQT